MAGTGTENTAAAPASGCDGLAGRGGVAGTNHGKNALKTRSPHSLNVVLLVLLASTGLHPLVREIVPLAILEQSLWER
eukprot:2959178-Rhodomonas_salina.4